jgi:HSP20 family protein
VRRQALRRPGPQARLPDSGLHLSAVDRDPSEMSRIRHRAAGRAAPRVRRGGIPTPVQGGSMQLTRWYPLAELDQIQQRLNRLLLDRTSTTKTGEPSFADFSPAVDIEETATEFIVKADLPDVKKEELKIQLENGVLAIEGERKQEKEEKGKKFHKIEREYGRFVRRFSLPTEVEAEKVRAEFKNGVLNVVLPKAPAATSKAIEVAIG